VSAVLCASIDIPKACDKIAALSAVISAGLPSGNASPRLTRYVSKLNSFVYNALRSEMSAGLVSSWAVIVGRLPMS
jgi:hypothetical protein